MRALNATILLMSFLAAGAQTTDTIPSFINTEANVIEGSLPRFHAGLQRLAEGADTVIHIVHIGDSHIQAEFVTDELRRLLNEKYGDAGRGLMPCLRLAGTNQSHEYAYTISDSTALQTRLLKYPWPVRPGFTGIAVEPQQDATVTFSMPGRPFNSLTVYTSEGADTLTFAAPVDSTAFPISAHEALYGAFATNGQPGIIYSAIGNNGACYTDYGLIRDFPKNVAALKPDLLILSMGTNEGFSTMTDFEIRRSVRNLVNALQAFSPKAEILVLAPMECQRNRRHGLKPLSPDFDINDRVAEAHDIIVDEARSLGLAIWDFYPVAGGHGASDKWLDAKLMNRDRIHLVRPGYVLQARLLFDALTR
ncbi:MAG: hypothetical protein K2M55_05475 [Muribaculaceae bacterium]|nr:hypothetical protein [Muribaculaceae bacterium]